MNAHLIIGTRVYTNICNSGLGTIFNVVTGGQVRFDIVFKSGNFLLSVNESTLLKNSQWEILEEQTSPEELAMDLAKAYLNKISNQVKKEEQDIAYKNAVAALQNNADFSDLEQSHEKITKNIRTQLKKAYPSVKFSVKKSGCDCISISWENGPICQNVEKITRRYKSGTFDGMTDSYSYAKTPWLEVFGGVSHIRLNRIESKKLIEMAIDNVFNKYKGNFKELEKPTFESFKEGKYIYLHLSGLNESVSRLIRAELNTLEM